MRPGFDKWLNRPDNQADLTYKEWLDNYVAGLEAQLETARKALERIPELPHASAMRVEAVDALRAIAKIGAGQKKHSCPVCNRVFSNWDSLLAHSGGRCDLGAGQKGEK